MVLNMKLKFGIITALAKKEYLDPEKLNYTQVSFSTDVIKVQGAVAVQIGILSHAPSHPLCCMIGLTPAMISFRLPSQVFKFLKTLPSLRKLC